MPIGSGDLVIEVQSRLAEPKPAAPLDMKISVNGKAVAGGRVPMTAPLTFTANDCLDIEYGWGSPRSTEYFDDALYKFEGTLGTTTISYSDK